jgi:hypothetical protein
MVLIRRGNQSRPTSEATYFKFKFKTSLVLPKGERSDCNSITVNPIHSEIYSVTVKLDREVTVSHPVPVRRTLSGIYA